MADRFRTSGGGVGSSATAAVSEIRGDAVFAEETGYAMA